MSNIEHALLLLTIAGAIISGVLVLIGSLYGKF